MPFAEIIKDINHIAGNASAVNHPLALAAHAAAEAELAEVSAKLTNCHPDDHAGLTLDVLAAKAKLEALSLLCQKLK